MNKSTKLYKKAMDFYYKGNMDRAIDFCDKSIAINFRNSAALNLKGLLLYIKGDLNEAKRTWELNYKGNKDAVSKKYLRDSREDIENKELYKKALILIKNLNISEAVQLLEKCSESHFNYINVMNNLAVCYMKQGEYNKAINCIDEVLKLDKKNKMAAENKRALIKFGVIKRQFNYQIIYKGIGIICIIVILVFIVNFSFKRVKNFDSEKIKQVANKISFSKITSKFDNDNKNIDKTEQFPGNNENSVDDIKDKNVNIDGENSNKELENAENTKNQEAINKKFENIKNTKNEVKKEEIQEDNEEKNIKENFPYEDLKISINNNNIDELYEYLKKWNGKSQNNNEKFLLTTAEDIMRKKGIYYFYKRGGTYFNQGDYSKSKEYFIKAITFSKGTYIYEQSLYMLGRSYNLLNDIENTTKYYDEYVRLYPKGDYIDEILYQLVKMYKDVDIDIAKKYAKILNENYSYSQYNNLLIKQILDI